MSDKPDFEKTQKELMEAFRKMMAETGKPQPQPEKAKQESDEKRHDRREKALRFDLKPKQVKKYLDRYVIKQEEAKRVLATTVCDHYNHVRTCRQKGGCKDYVKQNVILLGPTGVGKTYLIKTMADLIGVPFVKADATKFSETGYVGRDVDDLIRDLVQRAEGDIDLAEYGIVYLDEVDKIARASNVLGRDVSGAGVQQGLLKIMEDTEVPLRNPQDLQSQMEAVMEYQQTGKISKPTVNTRHILFIVSGAFGGLENIVKKRHKISQIGFQIEQTKSPSAAEALRKVHTEDFIEFGFEPEFIGRLPIRAVLDPLTDDDLYLILTTSEGSVLKQYKSAFEAYGIEMKFQEKALWEISKRSAEEKTGARGLITILEKVLRDLKYELPSSKLKSFTLTPRMVENPQEALKVLLKKEYEERREETLREIKLFEERFFKKTKFAIELDEEAKSIIHRKVIEEEIAVSEHLDKLLSNYEYGLGLIHEKKPRTKYILTAQVLSNPNAVLDRWIKEAYETGERT